MVTDEPDAAQVALLLLFFSTGSQLQLRHGHLLLHVADLLSGATSVLLVDVDKQGEDVPP